MAKSVILPSTREAVILRAGFCCEYCQSQDKFSPNSFTIDHVLPSEAGGTDEIENLAYACFLCNRLKSNKTTVFDAMSKTNVAMFNPRIHNWQEHFIWNGDYLRIIGLTPTGRGTVEVLQLNRKKLLDYRTALLAFGEHPPR
jgi:hypothetical protein